jgi:hypothetical protein
MRRLLGGEKASEDRTAGMLSWGTTRRATMYEHRSQPLISTAAFVWRLVRHGVVAGAIVIGSLVAGTAGYALFDGMAPVDAFLNASMILAGMGPVDQLGNDAAKVFAALYAIYSGVVFLVVVGVLFAPVAHRLLHRFHLANDDG